MAQIEWQEVSAIFFDLDDTLVPSEEIYDVVLQSMEVNRTAYLEARGRVKERLGLHVSARSRLLYFKELLEMTHSGTPEQILQWMDRYELLLSQLCDKHWRGLKRPSLFEHLAGRFPLFLVTNENTRTQLLKWRAIDPKARYFRRLISSEEVGVEKPDEKIFHTALKVAGVLPERCLFIGDSVKSDILPALKLGMQAALTIEFRNEKEIAPSQIPIISKLEEIASW
jgi:FMN phosphatase YigB (HAD superfamily)